MSAMRAKLYVETSVISYLTARPSRDVISLGHQQLTREWWDRAGLEFELYAPDWWWPKRSSVIPSRPQHAWPSSSRSRCWQKLRRAVRSLESCWQQVVCRAKQPQMHFTSVLLLFTEWIISLPGIVSI